MKKKKSNVENITSLKIYLEDYLNRFHNVNTKKFFCCLNPEHPDRNPSMRFSKKYNICKCFSCGVRYDIFDLIRLDYNCSTFPEQLKKLTELYHECVPSNIDSLNLEDSILDKDYQKYFKYCHSNIHKTNYLKSRGIDKQLIYKYYIGYDMKKKRVIFPITQNSYFGRNVEDSFKMKSKGKSFLWNEKLLDQSDNNTLIYLTESIIDALSLETINKNIKVISLNGLYNSNRLLTLIKEKNYIGNFVLAFDNDSQGILAQKKLKEELCNLNINSFPITLISNFKLEQCKDINEALLKDKEKLINNLNYFDEAVKKIITLKNEKEEDDYEL